MATLEIRIPQLGEGLHEARIVRFLKQPGDAIRRDEPIYEMETDKAVMEIECPEAGTLQDWVAAEGDVLPIGDVVATILTGDDQANAVTVEPASNAKLPVSLDGGNGLAHSSTPKPTDANGQIPTASPLPVGGLRNRHISPRARAYARSLGVTDEQISSLYTTLDRRILSDDVDRLLNDKEASAPTPTPITTPGKRSRSRSETPPSHKPISKERVTSPVAFEDIGLPTAQRTLIYRLQTATQAIIPATLELHIPWKPVEDTRESLRESGVECSQFLVFAWCVALAARNHPAFRSALLNDSTMRRYAHLHMGIAVARPGDELLIARVPDSDTMSLTDFVVAAQGAIGRAREGKDQASDAMQISLTNMASTGARFGIPVVAAPAVATLFIGAPWDEAYPIDGGGIGFRRLASMVMTFDHRMANGIGAANFMNEILMTVENLPQLTGS